MKRKPLTLCIVLLALAFIISGCTTNNTANPTGAATQARNTQSATTAPTAAAETAQPLMTAPGELPIVTQPVSVTIGLPQDPLITDYEDNYLTNYFKQKTGIDLVFSMLPTGETDAKQKFALMVASNEELPDVLSLSLSQSEKASYGSQGVFVALNDYLDNLAFYWTQQKEKWCSQTEQNNLIILGTSPDGNIYGLPLYAIDPTDAQAEGLWINKTWLDALGLAMPATTDDYFDALVAFRDNDPNGNSKQDEIPLIGSTGWVSNVAQLLMNSYIYYSDYMLNADSGVISAPFVQDEFRDGLRYIHKLVEEKLLSPLSFTQSLSELKAILSTANDQDTTVGTFCAHPMTVFPTDGSVERLTQYATLAPLAGPDGVAWAPSSVEQPNCITYITRNCENPEVAFRLLDFFCEETSSISIRFGEEGVNWKYTTEGDSVLPAEMGFSTLFTQMGSSNVWVTEGNTVWRRNIDFLPGRLFGSQSRQQFTNEVQEYIFVDLWWDTVPLRYGKNPPELVSTLIWTQAESDAISEIESTIKNYVNESVVRFALGDLDIEKDWDSYLNDLDNIGLSDYLQIAQTCYTRMLGGN